VAALAVAVSYPGTCIQGGQLAALAARWTHGKARDCGEAGYVHVRCALLPI
jgi:hypothetical protein